MRSFADYLSRKSREYGGKFDASALPNKFIPYFENGKRIEVEYHGERIRGTVGITTGWHPAFLLMKTKRSTGSEVLLSEDYTIVKEIRG